MASKCLKYQQHTLRSKKHVSQTLWHTRISFVRRFCTHVQAPFKSCLDYKPKVLSSASLVGMCSQSLASICLGSVCGRQCGQIQLLLFLIVILGSFCSSCCLQRHGGVEKTTEHLSKYTELTESVLSMLACLVWESLN